MPLVALSFLEALVLRNRCQSSLLLRRQRGGQVQNDWIGSGWELRSIAQVLSQLSLKACMSTKMKRIAQKSPALVLGANANSA